MPRPTLEVADIFRQHGAAYRKAHPLSYEQLRVMRAIEVCRTAVLGGHVEQCDHCDFKRHAYNSCRNRHCPKCQSTERAKWLESRQAELLPVEYFHVVFTLPEQIAEIAFYNKETVYGVLFRATAETLLTIARDPKHLGAEIGFFAILHSWGQNLLHHPHLHCVVPGGGLSPDHERWISCKAGFLLPVKALSRLFRRLFLEQLEDAFYRNKLRFPGSIEPLQDAIVFDALLRSHQNRDWVVYSKPPFGGPQRALEYLGRYTHRVAISNHRLLSLEDGEVTFQWKDYRSEPREKSKTMTVEADEFQRRFLIHTLPAGFQRIRHYGFLANCHRRDKLELCRLLLTIPITELLPQSAECTEMKEAITEKEDIHRCPHCGIGSMIRVAVVPCYRLARGSAAEYLMMPVLRFSPADEMAVTAATCARSVSTRRQEAFLHRNKVVRRLVFSPEPGPPLIPACQSYPKHPHPPLPRVIVPSGQAFKIHSPRPALPTV